MPWGLVKSVGTTLYEGGKATVGAVSDGVSEIVELAEDGYEITTETWEEIEEIASDPKGYLEEKLTDLAWDQVKGAVTLGLDEVAENLAREAGLGDLIDGIDAFAEVIEDAVAIAMKFIECAKWIENPTFIGLCSVLYAAREAGILTSKSQCEGYVKQADVIRVLGNVPVLDMLPCAIAIAFVAPLPSDIAGAKSTSTGSGSPGAKAKNKLEQSAGEVVVVNLSPLLGMMKYFIPHDVSAVSRTADQIDIFMVRPDGFPVTAARHPSEPDWKGWWLASEVKTSPDAPITTISRAPNMLDIFMVAENGHILTAGWEPTGDGWSKWWQLGDIKTEPGTRIGAVSRVNNRIDLFVTTHDKQIMTISRHFDHGGWGEWSPVAGGLAAPGAPVTAINRSADSLDVFVIGEDGHVWTSSRQYGRMKTPWRNWNRILDAKAMPTTQIGAASYAEGQVDIFVTDVDGKIRSAAHHVGDSKWGGWWHISEGMAHPKAPVTAISRADIPLTLFTVGLDNRIWASGWWPSVGWVDWSPLGDLKVPPTSRVDAISASHNSLEIFVRGSDRAVYWKSWKPQTGGWQDWERLS